MQERLYRIEELEEASGVSVRNIRYYTAEGLLPPPDSRGRFALYSEDHVRRLQLIQRLKEDFLPLDVIRTRLQEAGPQLAALSDSPEAPAPAASGSAAAYIARVMARGKAPPPSGAAPPPPPSAAPPAPAPAGPLRARKASQAAEEDPTAQDEAAPESWHRITLAPGVELHARRVDDRIRRLIAFARTLFRPDA